MFESMLPGWLKSNFDASFKDRETSVACTTRDTDGNLVSIGLDTHHVFLPLLMKRMMLFNL